MDVYVQEILFFSFIQLIILLTVQEHFTFSFMNSYLPNIGFNSEQRILCIKFFHVTFSYMVLFFFFLFLSFSTHVPIFISFSFHTEELDLFGNILCKAIGMGLISFFQFSEYHLLKMISFLQCRFLATLLNIRLM